MTTAAIQLKHLTKRYGTSRGVEDIHLTVPRGVIFGFLGPNGAGKSTTMNMLVNLTKPTSGTIEILGKDIQTHGTDVRRDIGYVSSDMALDGGLTGAQQLEYFGRLRGTYDKQHVAKLATRLNCSLERKIKTLSRGNRQKVALISALMHKPTLLLLDEPTSGLDPLMQAEFNKIILEHQQDGGTAFISSHALSEIQELCEYVAFIKEGKLISSTRLDALTTTAPKQVTIVSTRKAIVKDIQKLAGVGAVRVHDAKLVCTYAGEVRPLLMFLAKYPIDDLTISEADLETVFIEFYEKTKGSDVE